MSEVFVECRMRINQHPLQLANTWKDNVLTRSSLTIHFALTRFSLTRRCSLTSRSLFKRVSCNTFSPTIRSLPYKSLLGYVADQLARPTARLAKKHLKTNLHSEFPVHSPAQCYDRSISTRDSLCISMPELLIEATRLLLEMLTIVSVAGEQWKC